MTEFSNISTVAEMADVFDAAIRDADLGLLYNDWVRVKTRFEPMIARLRELSAAPAAGTDAYEMVAAVEQRNVETTETLIHMVAATVLAKLIDEEGGGRIDISFSPADMDEMHRRYEMNATHDGMLTTVSIKPRAGAFPPLSLRAEDGIDDTEAKPQAEHHDHDRPVWAIRYFDKAGNPYLAKMHDQGDAQRHLPDYMGPYDMPEPTIENRFCLHPDCPAERCNHDAPVSEGDGAAEVTSDS